MSGWRVLVNELYAQGGGPLPREKFDAVCGDAVERALQRARDLGLLRRAGREPKGLRRWTWELTRTGRGLVEGRFEPVSLKGSEGPGRGRIRFVATWLAALPARNAVRLSSEGVTWTYRPAQPGGH